MNKISPARMGVLAAVLAASMGAAACGGGGCGGSEEEEAAQTAAPIVCGEGTILQSGQCVARDSIRTR